MSRSRMNQGVEPAAVRSGCRRWLLCTTAVLFATSAAGPAALAVQPAGGQTSPDQRASPAIVLTGEGGQLSATIQQAVAPQHRVVISAGTSTVIDLSVAVKRVAVATPEVAELQILSPRQVLVTGISAGTTQAILWDEKDERLRFNVVVELNLSQLRDAIAQAAPDAPVEVHAVKDTIILSGQVPDVDSADRIVELATVVSGSVLNQMIVAGEQQVLLRCTIAEVDKRAVRRLGINGWLAGDNIRDVFVVNQIGGINPADIGLGPATDIIAPGALTFQTNGVPLGPAALSLGFPRVQMQLFFQALRRNSLMRILAEPNLVALSGHQASFLAGGEFPIPVSQGVGGAVTVEFREYGIRLNFVPTVIGRQKIRLKVAPEVSELDTSVAVQVAGFVVPGLSQRRAETTIELASGSTIAMAGLLREQLEGLVERIPGLGDIPVLGQLFRSEEYQRQLTELVILVTPEMVSSMNPDQVAALPGEFITEPNDWQLFGLGMIEGEPMPAGDDHTQALETKIPPRYRTYSSPPEQMSLHGPWGAAEAAEAVQ